MMIVLFSSLVIYAQTANAGESLDLGAVGELFKDSENLEKFEQSLNDSANGVNNLDLDEDGAVDFIRVNEQSEGDTHLIILQTAVGENDFQDVATIAVERENNDYRLQIEGDDELYGTNYYIVPAEQNFSAWNVVKRIFSPNYRVYVSPYRYRVYPKWFAVRREPVAVGVYRGRVGIYTGRRNFVASRTTTVRTVGKLNYRPNRSSVVVKKRTTTTTVTNPRNGNQRVKETTTVTKTRKGRRN